MWSSGYLIRFYLEHTPSYIIVRFTEYGPEEISREFVVDHIELNVPAYITADSNGRLLFDLEDITEYSVVGGAFIVG